jgi:hypothetical protein
MLGRLYGSLQEALSSDGEWVSFPQAGCGLSFGRCRRLDPDGGDRDWYEPCEPALAADGLPWFYFIASEKNLTSDCREEYLRESRKLWGSSP